MVLTVCTTPSPKLAVPVAVAPLPLMLTVPVAVAPLPPLMLTVPVARVLVLRLAVPVARALMLMLAVPVARALMLMLAVPVAPLPPLPPLGIAGSDDTSAGRSSTSYLPNDDNIRSQTPAMSMMHSGVPLRYFTM